jgi:DNA-directed RNA polymerase alpha subunit
MPDNTSDKPNPLLNQTLIAGLLSVLQEVVVKPKYEYIKVYEGSWRNLFLQEKKGFIIKGAYTDKIPDIEVVELFNQLGRKGWKLVETISTISNQYENTKSESYEIIRATTYKVHENSHFYQEKDYYYDDLVKTGYQDIPVSLPQPQSYFSTQYTYIFEKQVSYQSQAALETLFDILGVEVETREKAIKVGDNSPNSDDPTKLPIEEIGLTKNLVYKLKIKGIILVSDLLEQAKSRKNLKINFKCSITEIKEVQEIFDKLGVTLNYQENLSNDLNDKSNIPIEELLLPVGAYNALKRAGIYAVGDLLNYSAEDLLDDPINLGQKSADEICESLHTKLGITLELFGSDKDEIFIADDFDDPLEDF